MLELEIDQFLYRKVEKYAASEKMTVADAIAFLLSQGVTNLPARRTPRRVRTPKV